MKTLLSCVLASSLLLFTACGGDKSDGCSAGCGADTPTKTAQNPSDTPAKTTEMREVTLAVDGMS
jgi:hypothetical protein